MSAVKKAHAIGNFKVKTKRKNRKRHVQSKPHRDFLHSLSCVICGASHPEAAHLRYADAASGKTEAGMGARSESRHMNPLCASCHRTGPRAQHKMNEREFWESHGIDPIKLSAALWAVTGDYEAGMKAIMEARNG